MGETTESDKPALEKRFSAAKGLSILPTRQGTLTELAVPPVPLAGDIYDKVIHEWNKTDAPASDGLIQDLIYEITDRYPDSLAVSNEDNSKQLTYLEFDRYTNRIAHYLRESGVKPDDLVGICTNRSVNMLLAMVGILKSGGAYVALDPGFPKDRLAYIIKEAEITVVLYEEELDEFLSQIKELLTDKESKSHEETYREGPLIVKKNVVETITKIYPIERIPVSQFMGEEQTDRDGRLPNVGSSKNLAYVIFTSGSTGKPKGVQLEHISVVNFLQSMKRKPGMKVGDRILAVTTMSFDIAVLELFLPLICGGHVIIASRKTATDGIALKNTLEKVSPEIMQATPASWRLLIEAGWKGSKSMKILCGGEAFPPSLVSQLCGMVGEVWNMYGPTEATVWCTLKLLKEASEAAVSIGKPIDNCKCYVLDPESLEPVGMGDQGELHIAGPRVLARGYHKRQDLTDGVFKPNPFVPGTLMYKSGDLARYLPNGDIICVGRADYQVKINGYRIELGEIEAVVDRHPAVKANIVIVKGEGNSKQLVCYFVSENGKEAPNIGKLQEYILGFVPKYMVPSVFVELAELPLLPNGKVNRKDLPSPDSAKAHLTQEAVIEGRDKLEISLCTICEELLEYSPIGVNTNLFTIGGNSLFALRLHNRLKEEYSVDIPVYSILQGGNASYVAELVKQKTGGVSGESGDEVDLSGGAKAKKEVLTIVPLQPAGSKPPLFIFHSAGGFVFPYFLLAKLMGTDQPMYGFQDPGLDKDSASDTPLTVEELASRYMIELKKQQPEGPYYLAGWSLGGQIAWEISQRLKETGDEVSMLILIDMPIRESYKRATFWKDNILRGGAMIRQNIALRHQHLKKSGSTFRRGLYKALNVIVRGDKELQGGGDDDDDAGPVNTSVAMDSSTSTIVAILDRHMKAAASYIPKPYDGKTLVIRCEQQTGSFYSEFEEWYHLAPNGVFRSIDCNHYNVLRDPHVHIIVDMMKEALSNALYLETGVPRESPVSQEKPQIISFQEYDEYSNTGITLRSTITSSPLNVFTKAVKLQMAYVRKPKVVDAVSFEYFEIWHNEQCVYRKNTEDLIQLRRKANENMFKYEVGGQDLVFTQNQQYCTSIGIIVKKPIEGTKFVTECFQDGASLFVQEDAMGEYIPREEPYEMKFVDTMSLPLGKYFIRVVFLDSSGTVLFKFKYSMTIADPVPEMISESGEVMKYHDSRVPLEMRDSRSGHIKARSHGWSPSTSDLKSEVSSLQSEDP
eukprot:Nk52_evm24s2657 gene=Nk52_evmTU24s2657